MSQVFPLLWHQSIQIDLVAAEIWSFHYAYASTGLKKICVLKRLKIWQMKQKAIVVPDDA